MRQKKGIINRIETLSMDKILLDNILEKHKAQPVGHGYIDIIVSRDNYKDFIAELLTNEFKINSISWWEWCEENSPGKYGLGGPESIFYKGWFSEIPVNVDEINFSINTASEAIIRGIQNIIETKTISFSDKTVTFSNSNWLTPAIWLGVPDNWRNKYNA